MGSAESLKWKDHQLDMRQEKNMIMKGEWSLSYSNSSRDGKQERDD